MLNHKGGHLTTKATKSFTKAHNAEQKLNAEHSNIGVQFTTILPSIPA